MATASVTLSSYNLLIDGDGYADGFLGIDVRGAKAVLVSPTPAGTLPIWNVVLDVIGQKPYTIDMRTVTYPGWGSSEAGAKKAVADISAILAIAPIAGGGGVQSVNSGTDITVDNTDPLNPIVNYTGGGGGGVAWGSITGTLSAQTDLQAALDAKEPTITGSGSASDYWNGLKVFVDFATSVRAAILTGISFVTATAVTAADSVLVAIGKLQAQITANIAAILLKADIASPTFTGVPAAPTAAVGTNTTQLATTEFITTALATQRSVLASNVTTTSTTNVDVTGLVANAVATGSYVVMLVGPVQSSNVAGQISLSLTVPAGASVVGWRNQGTASGGASASTFNVSDALSLGTSPGAANTSVSIILTAQVNTTGTSGVIQVRMASGSGSHTARSMTGMSMIVTQMA